MALEDYIDTSDMWFYPEPEWVNVFGKIIKETLKAYCFKTESGIFWIPKSQIRDFVKHDDGRVSMNIALWLWERLTNPND